MATLSEIKDVISAVNAEQNRRYNQNVGDQIAPTIGSDNRLHAPCDGYVWMDRVFLGGQYLPEDDDYCTKPYSIKIKIALSLVPEIQEFLGGSAGKSWVQNDVSVCYFYAQVSKAEQTALLKILPEGGKKIVLVDEYGAGTSKSWKFSAGRVVANLQRQYGWSYVDFMEIAAPGVYFELKENKKGELKYCSSFDGKMVRYHYIDNTIYC